MQASVIPAHEILLEEPESQKNWAAYDVSQFPQVNVKMFGKIRDDNDFENFLNGWRELYSRGERFTLNFDTNNVGMESMKYAFRMRSFIRELKREKPKLLERSYIKVNSRWNRFLLKVIFFMEKPVADVVIEDGSGNTTLVKS